MTLHAQRERLEAAQCQERIERTLDGADRVLQKGESFAQLLVRPDDRHAADHVGMAVEVLGGGMHDEIEAEFQRVLDIGAGEGVVGSRQDAALPGDRGDTLEIDQLQERVGRGLDPDQPGVRADRSLDRARIGQIEVGRLQSHRAVAYPLEQAARAAVEIVDRDDMRAVVEAFERGCDGRQAGSEGERRAAAFEVGDAALERHAGGIRGARVVEAFVHAGALLHEGGRGVDRHHHGAGGRIGRLARMDAAGGEGEPVRLGHSGLIFRSRPPALLSSSAKADDPVTTGLSKLGARPRIMARSLFTRCPLSRA